MLFSRTLAMPSSPSQKASWTNVGNGLPTTPTAAYLAAEGISPTTRPGREGNKRCAGTVWYASGDVKYGAGPAQPTSHHPTITSHQSITSVVPNVTTLHWADGLPYSFQLRETGP